MLVNPNFKSSWSSPGLVLSVKHEINKVRKLRATGNKTVERLIVLKVGKISIFIWLIDKEIS